MEYMRRSRIPFCTACPDPLSRPGFRLHAAQETMEDLHDDSDPFRRVSYCSCMALVVRFACTGSGGLDRDNSTAGNNDRLCKISKIALTGETSPTFGLAGLDSSTCPPVPPQGSAPTLPTLRAILCMRFHVSCSLV